MLESFVVQKLCLSSYCTASKDCYPACEYCRTPHARCSVECKWPLPELLTLLHDPLCVFLHAVGSTSTAVLSNCHMTALVLQGLCCLNFCVRML